MMRAIFCNAPVGNGMVTLHGDAGTNAAQTLDLVLNVEHVPAGAVAQLARRAKKDLPPDLVATGIVRGNFTVKEETPSHGPDFQGRGEVTNLRLQSASSKVELATANVPFTLGPDGNSGHDSLRGKLVRRFEGEPSPVEGELRIEFGPFPVALGRPVPAQARGWVGRSGYAIAVRGDGEVSHTLRIASLLGLQAVKAGVEGTAQMDLQIAGSWADNASGNPAGFSLPKVTGTAQLHNVRATARGLRGPIEISSAELLLAPEEARVGKLRARAGDADWTG
jgi:hypothetical protein